MRPLPPSRVFLRARVAFAYSPRGRVLPGLESPVAGDVPGAHRALKRNGSFASALRPDRQLAVGACRGRSELLAYCGLYSTVSYTIKNLAEMDARRASSYG